LQNGIISQGRDCSKPTKQNQEQVIIANLTKQIIVRAAPARLHLGTRARSARLA
jgi:hypothetical protein